MSEVGKLPRKTRRRFEIFGQARFLTFSCFQRLPLFANDAIKDAFIEQLSQSRIRTGFQMVGYVVMPEHVHLTLVPQLPEAPVARVLSDLKGSFANSVLRRWRDLDAPVLSRLRDSRRKERFWQVGGGHDRNIETHEELIEKVNYMHANPVTRELVNNPVDWRWSSARWYAGIRPAECLSMDINAFA